MPDDMPDDAASPVVEVADARRGADRRRLRWAALPQVLRDELEAVADASVVAELPVDHGFSPGIASILTFDDGQRLFVKGACSSDEPFAADLIRAEGRVTSRLPREIPASRFAWGHGDGDWVVLAFEVIDGHMPQTPWDPDELDRVLDALTLTASVPGARALRLPPTGPDFAEQSTGWRRLRRDPDPGLGEVSAWASDHVDELVEAERGALVACEGESFVHGDLRADNVLLTADRVHLVDWAHSSRGAAWLDLALLLPSVVMQGVQGVLPPVDRTSSERGKALGGAWATSTFDSHPLGRTAHPADLRAVVAGIAGYFMHNARLPEPVTIPGLRSFQRAQGVTALVWLEHLGF